MPAGKIHRVRRGRILPRTPREVNGQSSGAVADAGTGEETNWGLAGVKTFSFNYIPKGGKTIKYVETPQGNDSPYPTVDYGMLIIPYGSGVTVQGEGFINENLAKV